MSGCRRKEKWKEVKTDIIYLLPLNTQRNNPPLDVVWLIYLFKMYFFFAFLASTGQLRVDKKAGRE